MPNYVNMPYCVFFFFWWDRDDLAEPILKWHVYVTGHSLGGALATLLALELSSSQLAK
jgi:esterase/lipase